MNIKFSRRQDNRVHKYATEDAAIVNMFCDDLKKELKDALCGSILFGSTARKQRNEHSDIDVLVIVDDVSFQLNDAFTYSYRLLLKNMIAKHSSRLHVTSMTLSSFWDYARAGDPVVVNVLREGVPLLDSGFIAPLQKLLVAGKIRPSEESVWRYFSRAPKTLRNSQWHMLQATLDLYWAVMDSAHALCMKDNIVPPTPHDLPNIIHAHFVKNKQMKKHHVETIKRFYRLNKMIVYRELQSITGEEYQRYYEEAESFVRHVKKLLMQ